MEVHWDKVDRRILLGDYKLRGDHAAADQVRVCRRFDLNWTPSYVRIFDHMYPQFLLAQNSTGDGFSATRLLFKFVGLRARARVCVHIESPSCDWPVLQRCQRSCLWSTALSSVGPCGFWDCAVVTWIPASISGWKWNLKFLWQWGWMHIMFSGFIWRVIWKVDASFRRTYPLQLEGRNWTSLQVPRSCPTYLRCYIRYLIGYFPHVTPLVYIQLQTTTCYRFSTTAERSYRLV